MADSWFEKLMTKLEWWTYQRATSKLYDSVSLDGPQLEAEQNLYETSGGMWDADAAVVMPCKVLEAFLTLPLTLALTLPLTPNP